MAESIGARVGRLISGTANALVDAVENVAPELVMEEAIREVDRGIEDVRAELGTAVSKQHMAARRLADANAKHLSLSDKISLALAENREDLAETAVTQLLDVEAQIPVLESTIADARSAETELEAYVAALQARKREMKDELAAFRDAKAAAESSARSGGDFPDTSAGGGVEGGIRRAEAAFERALTGAGGVTSASAAPDVQTAAKTAELDELVRKNRVRERLEAFKAKG